MCFRNTNLFWADILMIIDFFSCIMHLINGWVGNSLRHRLSGMVMMQFADLEMKDRQKIYWMPLRAGWLNVG